MMYVLLHGNRGRPKECWVMEISGPCKNWREKEKVIFNGFSN